MKAVICLNLSPTGSNGLERNGKLDSQRDRTGEHPTDLEDLREDRLERVGEERLITNSRFVL
jgi:hypothetical protein